MKYSTEEIAIATRKCYEDIEKELLKEKEPDLILKLLERGELSKKQDFSTKVIAIVNFQFSLKIADVPFLEKEGYLR